MKNPFFYLLISIYLLCQLGYAKEELEINNQDNIKAVFIYNFTKYFEWIDDTSQTFDITILGDSNIIRPLEEIAEKRETNNKKITIKQISKIDDIDKCHILYIANPKKYYLSAILLKTENKNILTISDCRECAKKGFAVNFILIDGKIRFEVNVNAVKDAGLEVSSQLLKLAIIVGKE